MDWGENGPCDAAPCGVNRRQQGGSLRQQTVVFTFDDRIALANSRLQPRAIKYADVTAVIVNEARFLQISGRLCNALPPYAEHVGDQLLGHRQFT